MFFNALRLGDPCTIRDKKHRFYQIIYNRTLHPPSHKQLRVVQEPRERMLTYICLYDIMPKEVIYMKRTMIYLPVELHRGLKRLAAERDNSVAELIREAVMQVYKEDLEDIRDAEMEIAKYKKGIDYSLYRTQRLEK